MATNRDVQNFDELRQGFQGMADFAGAGLRFLDRLAVAFGHSTTSRTVGRPTSRTNGHANGNGVSALREQIKRQYSTRKSVLTSAEEKRRVRAQSAAVLNALDRVESRPVTSPEGQRAIGALVRRGYAKKKGDGYIRTAKPFVVDTHTTTAATGGATLTVAEAAKVLKISPSYVRNLIKRKQLAARHESRPRAGRGVSPLKITVLDREEIDRYVAAYTAAAEASPA
jgi:hypothetical protein